MSSYDLVPFVRFPRSAGERELTGGAGAGLFCPRCGDPYTSGCSGHVCVILSADVDDATAERLAEWLYDYRYGLGRWHARFVAGPEQGEELHGALVDEARALLGSFVLGDLGWKPPGDG